MREQVTVVMRIACRVVKGQDQAVCIWLGKETDYEGGRAFLPGSNRAYPVACQGLLRELDPTGCHVAPPFPASSLLGRDEL
jgi:hypothetical protein